MMLLFNLKQWVKWGAVLALIVVVFGPIATSASAQSAADARKTAEAAMRSGLAAQKARKHSVAVQWFSRAISSGALERKQLSYALYRRAVSNRADKRPAQAISDLNSALFFKGDLSSGDRKSAIAERARAYKDAGLQPTELATGEVRSPTAVEPAATKTAAAATRGSVGPRRSRSTLPPTAPILGPDTPGGRQPIVTVPAKTRSGTAQSRASRPSTAGQSWSVQTKPTPAKSQSSRQQRPPAQSSWNSSTAVSGAAANSGTAGGAQRRSGKPSATAPGTGGFSSFFSSIFGGSPTPVSNSSQQVTGAIGRRKVAAPQASTPVTGFQATVKPASPSASVKRGTVRRPDPRRATPAPAVKRTVAARQPAAPRATGGSAFQIQVASLRSRKRATVLAQKLMKRYSGGHKAQVAEVPGGSRGNVFVVRYGYFTDKFKVASVCEKLVADGFGCLVRRR